MRFWSACLTILLLFFVFSGNAFSQTQIVYQDQENEAEKESDAEEGSNDQDVDQEEVDEKAADSEEVAKAKPKKKGEKANEKGEESDTDSVEELKSTAGGIDLDEVPTKVIDL